MKLSNRYLAGALAAGVVTFLSPVAWATDITISDTMGGGSFGTDTRGVAEDQEVEPGNVTGQSWDLEAFVIQNNKLYLIGGFNFLEGQVGNNLPFYSGDIFIDTDGDAIRGADILTSTLPGYHYDLNNADYQYNYVIDLNFEAAGSPTYAVHFLNDKAALLQSVYYRQNDEANPYRYLSGAEDEDIATGTVEYTGGLSDQAVLDTFGVALRGGTHNVVGIDMSWFDAPDILTHFTMACGNDNLMGELSGGFDVPDSGSTLMLLGLVLAAMAGVGRRLKN